MKILKCNNDIHFENFEVYSEEEVAIGSFLGEPLYRKCVVKNETIAKGQQIDITSTNIKQLIKVAGTCTAAGGLYAIPCSSETHFDFYFSKSANKLICNIASSAVSKLENVFLFIEYTKAI